jgi:hypothetical protein
MVQKDIFRGSQCCFYAVNLLGVHGTFLRGTLYVFGNWMHSNRLSRGFTLADIDTEISE